MMLDKNKTGMVLGKFMFLAHLAWSVVVLLGWGQFYLDKIFHLHYLNNPFTVANFTWAKMGGLLVVVFIAGYIAGWVFAYLWNWVHEK